MKILNDAGMKIKKTNTEWSAILIEPLVLYS